MFAANRRNMASRSYRPGQFGIFTVLERGSDLNSIITSELASVSGLRLKKIEWIDLGSQIVAILFSSFKSQIYLSEWQQLLFKSMFRNTSSTEMLRDNSRHVVKIIAAARQQNSLSINLFQVATEEEDIPVPPRKAQKTMPALPVLPQLTMVDSAPQSALLAQSMQNIPALPVQMTALSGPSGPIATAMVQTRIDSLPKKRPLETASGMTSQALVTSPINLFALNPKRTEVLKLFLRTTKACWNTPLLPFRERASTEDLQTYVVERKTYYNRQAPKIASIMQLYLPLIMRRSDLHNQTGATNMQLVSLSPAHLTTLASLFQWHHASGWKGMMALFPWNNLECVRYDFNFTEGTTAYPIIHPSASVLEAHRRVIELERACFDLTDYLNRSISKNDCMHGFPQQHLKLTLVALNAGGGLFGSGSGFWNSPPSNLQAIERLMKVLGNTDVSSEMGDDSLWLHQNREACFVRKYTVLTELDWGMPLLALIHRMQHNLCRLDEEGNATVVLAALEEEVRERTALYIKDLESLLLYGGRLTRYVRTLYGLCSEHFSIMNRIPGLKSRLTFPGNCKLLQLSPQGKIIGPDGQATEVGHLQLQEASLADGSRPPIPFPDSCCDIQPDPNLDQLALARTDKEERLVAEMLTSLFGSADEPTTITAMRRGRKNALRRLWEDSHKSRCTCVFPPSASMPSATYLPEQLFQQDK